MNISQLLIRIQTDTMAKKSSNITERDMKCGNIYKCYNCETKCNDDIQLIGVEWCMGRTNETGKIKYLCSDDCATYVGRENDRIRFNECIRGLIDGEIPMLKEAMRYFVAKGWDAKFIINIIKMDKWYVKLLNTIMEQKTERDIVAVELIKFSEYVMEIAEAFNAVNTDDETSANAGVVEFLKERTGMTYYTLCNMAMWADSFGKNTRGRLDVWF